MFDDFDFTEDVRKLLDKESLEEILERKGIDPEKVLLILLDYGFDILGDDEQE